MACTWVNALPQTKLPTEEITEAANVEKQEEAVSQEEQTDLPTETTETPKDKEEKWEEAMPKEEQTDLPTEETTETAKEDKEEGAMEKCNVVMANNGLNFSSFWHGAAHGIHSIGLEEIRHFFEPDAPEENRIPVVNANLTADQTILFHSPLRGYDEDFKTMAMKVMAFFMLHDKPYFFQQVHSNY